MDRQIIYPGQLLPETSLLQMTKDSMIGAAKLASAILGTSTMASGFAVTPTGPASLQVLCAPGEIYSMTAIDALAFSTLPADTTHSILKQGILLDGMTLSCPAPVTTGQSINYLVQVTYQDADSTPVLLPYYNSANPSLPYSGMGNNGLTQNTARKGAAIVSVKAGVSASTGSQVTPAPDAGNIGLYAVTVAFGQTTIVAGNIAALTTAPFINSTLHGLTPTFSVPVALAPATQSQHAMQLGQAVGRLLGPPQVFGTPGTFPYTQTPGTNKIFLEVQGGCAASGGAPATGAGVSSLGGPGGAGAYASAFISAAFSGVTITVGAGGTGVSGSTGNNGGPSSFGALISAPGGIGGTAAGPSSSVFESTANNTAAPSGGNIKSTVGLRGTTTISLSPTALFLGNPGQGVLGGLGGTATGNTPSLAAKTGNPGDNGKVIVWEYA